MNPAIRVLVADDQRVVREGLGTLLGLLAGVEVVGTAADGDEALALAIRLRPDVVLMDLRMPHCDGVEATRRLRDHDASIKVLVLTTYTDDRSLIDALQRVTSGQAAIDAAAQQHLVHAIATGPATAATPQLPAGLTQREAEVLALIAQGLSNIEIAGQAGGQLDHSPASLPPARTCQARVSAWSSAWTAQQPATWSWTLQGGLAPSASSSATDAKFTAIFDDVLARGACERKVPAAGAPGKLLCRTLGKDGTV